MLDVPYVAATMTKNMFHYIPLSLFAWKKMYP